MGNAFDYKAFFDHALRGIKLIRDPHSARHESYDTQLDEVKQERLFDYGGSAFERYSNILKLSRTHSVASLKVLISALLMKYKIAHKIIHVSIEGYGLSKIEFAVKDTKSKELFFFKEVEEDNYWRTEEEHASITQIMNEHEATSCKYIYLVFDKAYLQIMNHNDDISDPGRGTNVYSIQWFFETYFGLDEYSAFKESMDSFTAEVKEYLGYIQVKSLTSRSLVNFRRIVDSSIRSFRYNKLLVASENEDELDQTQFDLINKQYLDANLSTIMLGSSDFAESFITAEWLYGSMKKAKAIDLTVIALGYFKAIEQLFYGIVCFHKDENRTIQCNNRNRKVLGRWVRLTSEHIKNEVIDTTLGSLAGFLAYFKNFDLISDTLTKESKEFIAKKLTEVSRLRNDFLHRHNIHDWLVIDLIRSMALVVSFLVLGSYKLTDNEMLLLGKPNEEPFTDYYRLYEYFDYHQNNLFCLQRSDGDILWVKSHPDLSAELVQNSFVKYSGIYYRRFGTHDESVYSIKEVDIPESIYLGIVKFGWTGEIKIDLVKGMKIFEKGKFIGSSIADEESFDY